MDRPASEPTVPELPIARRVDIDTPPGGRTVVCDVFGGQLLSAVCGISSTCVEQSPASFGTARH
jgi:hypothetical protein